MVQEWPGSYYVTRWFRCYFFGYDRKCFGLSGADADDHGRANAVGCVAC